MMKKSLPVASSLALALLAACSSPGETSNEAAPETNFPAAAESINVPASSEAQATVDRKDAKPEPKPVEKAAVAPKAQPKSAPKAPPPPAPKPQPATQPKVEPQAPAAACSPEHHAAGHC